MKELAAIARLIEIARTRESGQARKVADFLLAWHNATENGGWDPVDLWGVDEQIAEDMLTVLEYLRGNRKYLDDIGFEREVRMIWQMWRGEARG